MGAKNVNRMEDAPVGLPFVKRGESDLRMAMLHYSLKYGLLTANFFIMCVDPGSKTPKGKYKFQECKTITSA